MLLFSCQFLAAKEKHQRSQNIRCPDYNRCLRAPLSKKEVRVLAGVETASDNEGSENEEVKVRFDPVVQTADPKKRRSIIVLEHAPSPTSPEIGETKDETRDKLPSRSSLSPKERRKSLQGAPPLLRTASTKKFEVALKIYCPSIILFLLILD